MGMAPTDILDRATANGNNVANFSSVKTKLSLQVILTGSPSGGTVTLLPSLDGVNFDTTALLTFTIGTDASGVMKFVVDKPFSALKAVLAGLTGGTSPTVTAKVAVAD